MAIRFLAYGIHFVADYINEHALHWTGYAYPQIFKFSRQIISVLFLCQED